MRVNRLIAEELISWPHDGYDAEGFLLRCADSDAFSCEVGKVPMYKAILSGFNVIVMELSTGRLYYVNATSIVFSVNQPAEKTVVISNSYGEVYKDRNGYHISGNTHELAISLAQELEAMRERVLIADQADDQLRKEQFGK